jgi:N-acetyl-gamma-glutamyl-phosphate reductase
MEGKAKVAVLGASGYAGAELLRLLIAHPRTRLALLTADRKVGQSMREIFPQFAPYVLPDPVTIESVDWAASRLDFVFCALPHATTQRVIAKVIETAPTIKIVDLSADFRLSDPAIYQRWYGQEHFCPELQKEAVYGLVEVYRMAIKTARLVANPGCYTTCAQLPIIPLLKVQAIVPDEIVIDAKSGVTGAGRSVKEAMLFSEVAEGVNAYGIGRHRHMAELDQEFTRAAGHEVIATFTPHLMPMNRGLLSTIYVRGQAGCSPEDLHAILAQVYAKEPFVRVMAFGEVPDTRHVRGSNHAFIGVAKDRIPGRAILVSVIDNLVKGASGQAVQSMNLMLDFPETLGLDQVPLFP